MYGCETYLSSGTTRSTIHPPSTRMLASSVLVRPGLAPEDALPEKGGRGGCCGREFLAGGADGAVAAVSLRAEPDPAVPLVPEVTVLCLLCDRAELLPNGWDLRIELRMESAVEVLAFVVGAAAVEAEAETAMGFTRSGGPA